MPRSRTTAPPAAPPADIRLMNSAATAVFVLAGLALAAAGLAALMRLPAFTLQAIRVDGGFGRSNVATIRANALPRLAGNFFSVDLGAARAAFEAVPWVRQAVVRRVWPNALDVTLLEHEAAALWQGEEGNDRLVNAQGDVFEANPGDVEEEGLPTFAGPEGSAARMLALYRRLLPAFAPVPDAVVRLQLSGRGSWRAELDSGATVELGRGSDDEVLARSDRFVRTLPQVAARFPNRPVDYADLRHADGYALRIRGVTTTLAASAPKR